MFSYSVNKAGTIQTTKNMHNFKGVKIACRPVVHIQTLVFDICILPWAWVNHHLVLLVTLILHSYKSSQLISFKKEKGSNSFPYKSPLVDGIKEH